jgi:hypothetical protein
LEEEEKGKRMMREATYEQQKMFGYLDRCLLKLFNKIGDIPCSSCQDGK